MTYYRERLPVKRPETTHALAPGGRPRHDGRALETPNRERLRPDWRVFLVGGVVN